MDQNKHDLESKMSSRAQALLDDMASRNYKNAIIHFDTNMTSTVPSVKLEELWNTVQAPEKAGAFVERISTRTEMVNSRPIEIILCKFEKGNVELLVAFDAAANISGLDVRAVTPPPAAKASTEATNQNIEPPPPRPQATPEVVA